MLNLSLWLVVSLHGDRLMSDTHSLHSSAVKMWLYCAHNVSLKIRTEQFLPFCSSLHSECVCCCCNLYLWLGFFFPLREQNDWLNKLLFFFLYLMRWEQCVRDQVCVCVLAISTWVLMKGRRRRRRGMLLTIFPNNKHNWCSVQSLWTDSVLVIRLSLCSACLSVCLSVPFQSSWPGPVLYLSAWILAHLHGGPTYTLTHPLQAEPRDLRVSPAAGQV